MSYSFANGLGDLMTGGLMSAGKKFLSDKNVQSFGEKGYDFFSNIDDNLGKFWDRLTGRDLTKEQFEYQKWYDANKYQLSSSDLLAAGLSKTLSTNGGAGSSAVQSSQGSDQLGGVLSILSTISGIHGSNAQADYSREQAQKLANENKYFSEHGYFPDSKAGNYDGLSHFLDEKIKQGFNTGKGILQSSVNVVDKAGEDVFVKSAQRKAEKQAQAERIKALKGASKKDDKPTYNNRVKYQVGGSDKEPVFRNVPVYQRGGR